MKIQYVSKYIALSEEGLVSKLACPLDQGLLAPNQDLNDKIYLYCISCDYKSFIGYEYYNNIVKKVEEASNGM